MKISKKYLEIRRQRRWKAYIDYVRKCGEKGIVPLPFREWKKKKELEFESWWRETVSVMFEIEEAPRKDDVQKLDRELRLKITANELAKLYEKIGDLELKRAIVKVLELIDAQIKAIQRL